MDIRIEISDYNGKVLQIVNTSMDRPGDGFRVWIPTSGPVTIDITVPKPPPIPEKPQTHGGTEE